MDRNEQEKDELERRLAEQALAREALDARNERLAELEAEVKYLRRTLNDLMAAPRPAHAPARAKAPAVPRRWTAAV